MATSSLAVQLGSGSITDVSGVRVGHSHRIGRGWQTGTTVVFVPDGATPGVDVRGGGPGTRETDAVAQQNLVERIHAITLTGGSAFGLAAADGVMAELEQLGLGVPVGVPDGDGHQQVVPVVPTAVIFDLGRGGDPRKRPDSAMGLRALRNARRSQRAWGAVGAGAGARAGGLQGGVGTASTSVTFDDLTITVGALAVVNAAGSAIDSATGRPWIAPPHRLGRPTAAERRQLEVLLGGTTSPLNTTIGVVATSASCTKSEAFKIASVGHDGLARAIRPAHTMFDGDTVFALATGQHALAGITLDGSPVPRPVVVNHLLVAAAETFAAACTHGVLSARAVGAAPGTLRADARGHAANDGASDWPSDWPDGVPGYFDVCRSIDPG